MKLIILDRDGVINKESADYIRNSAEWIPIAGALEAIAKLTLAGYTITVLTNQSGVGRGYFTLQDLENIHATMLEAVSKFGGKIAKIYFCPHAPVDNCECRKPKSGMIRQMEQDFNFKCAEIKPILVGDSLRDVIVGLDNSCQVFVVTKDSHGDQTVNELSAAQKQQVTILPDLQAVVTRLLE